MRIVNAFAYQAKRTCQKAGRMASPTEHVVRCVDMCGRMDRSIHVLLPAKLRNKQWKDSSKESLKATPINLLNAMESAECSRFWRKAALWANRHTGRDCSGDAESATLWISTFAVASAALKLITCDLASTPTAQPSCIPCFRYCPATKSAANRIHDLYLNAF